MKTMKFPKSLLTENSSKAVLLLHAYSGSSNDVRMLARYLERKNYTVYAPNFSGHGTFIPEHIINQSTKDWKEDTLNAIDFLKEKGYQQIAVFGLSLGGLLAMNSLTEDIEGIIGGGFFCSPIVPVKNNVVKNFNLYAEKMFELADIPLTERTTRLTAIQKESIQQMKDIERFSEETVKRLSLIKVPIFMAQAGKDEMIDAYGVYQTANQLSHVRHVLNWYPESGHVITTSSQHKQFEQDVANFLATLSWNEEKK